MRYESLPICSDLCVSSLKAAVTKLQPKVSCDLHVSQNLAEYAKDVLALLPNDFIVNRIRVDKYYKMARFEWFIECADGSAVGCLPPD